MDTEHPGASVRTSPPSRHSGSPLFATRSARTRHFGPDRRGQAAPPAVPGPSGSADLSGGWTRPGQPRSFPGPWVGLAAPCGSRKQRHAGEHREGEESAGSFRGRESEENACTEQEGLPPARRVPPPECDGEQDHAENGQEIQEKDRCLAAGRHPHVHGGVTRHRGVRELIGEECRAGVGRGSHGGTDRHEDGGNRRQPGAGHPGCELEGCRDERGKAQDDEDDSQREAIPGARDVGQLGEGVGSSPVDAVAEA